jgi:hypothetical protein
VLARWKEHFEEHLNEGSESERPKGAEIPEKQQGSWHGFYLCRAVEKRWTLSGGCITCSEQAGLD